MLSSKRLESQNYTENHCNKTALSAENTRNDDIPLAVVTEAV